MADDTDGSGEEGDVTSEVPAGFEADPPSYRSGRVRIIGAEPAGNAVHEVTGPVVEENPDMPHWNDAPTGQVPAILDRGNGDEQALAPPSWREEDSDWAAHEELFEPSMLSDEVPPVGSMMNNNNDIVDMERQPWLFDTDDLSDDDTLVIEPDRPPETPRPASLPRLPTRRRFLPPRHRSVPHRSVGCGRACRGPAGRACCGRACSRADRQLRPGLHRSDRPDRAGSGRIGTDDGGPDRLHPLGVGRHREPDRRDPPGAPGATTAPRAGTADDPPQRGEPRQRQRHWAGRRGATCSWPGGRAFSWAWWRCSAPTSAACSPWSSSPWWCSWPRQRGLPPSAPPGTTRRRCWGWWRSCR